MPQNLWAPWRLAYVSADGPEDGCFLCRAAQSEVEDRQSLVVWRGDHCYCILNRFTYNNGHLMVAPYEHAADLAELSDAALLESMRALVTARDVLRYAINAKGFNIGWNLGACAGAGLEGHLHAHLVPRWPGDTNFMPVLADVKVIPQSLEELWEQLSTAWPRESHGSC